MSDPSSSRPADDLGRLIEVAALRAEASRRLVELIESRSLLLLERIAVALERAPLTRSGVGEDVRGQARGLVEFRMAVDEARWDQPRRVGIAHLFLK